jgi:hypothetical protein
MMNKLPIFAPALASLMLLTACDEVALLPDTAQDAGVDPAYLSVVLSSDTEGVSADIAAVEVEVVEVLVHRPADDRWILVSPEPVAVDVMQAHGTFTYEGIPLMPGMYDAVHIVLGSVRVAHGGYWHPAEVTDDEIVQWFEWELDHDATLEVSFDLAAALGGSPDDGWTFEPAVQATLDGQG